MFKIFNLDIVNWKEKCPCSRIGLIKKYLRMPSIDCNSTPHKILHCISTTFFKAHRNSKKQKTSEDLGRKLKEFKLQCKRRLRNLQ